MLLNCYWKVFPALLLVWGQFEDGDTDRMLPNEAPKEDCNFQVISHVYGLGQNKRETFCKIESEHLQEY